jgi:hypothetical protein
LRQFSQKFTDEVVSSYFIEPEPNRFGMINAFTNAAQGLAPLQRIEMERFAETLLEAPYIALSCFKSGKQIRLPFFFFTQDHRW